jgi:hypothetical protein
MMLFPMALGEIGTQHRGKLRFFQDIDQFQLIQAIQYLGGRYPQTRCARAGDEF